MSVGMRDRRNAGSVFEHGGRSRPRVFQCLKEEIVLLQAAMEPRLAEDLALGDFRPESGQRLRVLAILVLWVGRQRLVPRGAAHLTKPVLVFPFSIFSTSGLILLREALRVVRSELRPQVHEGVV